MMMRSKQSDDDKHDVFSHLMASWVIAYDHTILQKYASQYKRILDEVASFAVKEFSERLVNLGLITEDDIAGNRFENTEDAILHHVNNLVSSGVMDDQGRPKFYETEVEHVDYLEIPHCEYRESCQWHKDKGGFRNIENYPCQRLGALVGAAKRYIKEDVLVDRQDIGYFMSKVIEDDGCAGYIYIASPLERQKIMNEKPKMTKMRE